MPETTERVTLTAPSDTWKALENALDNYGDNFSDSADYWILIEGHEMPSSRRDFVGGLRANYLPYLFDKKGDQQLTLVPGAKEILADVLDELRSEMELTDEQQESFREIESQLS